MPALIKPRRCSPIANCQCIFRGLYVWIFGKTSGSLYIKVVASYCVVLISVSSPRFTLLFRVTKGSFRVRLNRAKAFAEHCLSVIVPNLWVLTTNHHPVPITLNALDHSSQVESWCMDASQAFHRGHVASPWQVLVLVIFTSGPSTWYYQIYRAKTWYYARLFITALSVGCVFWWW